MHPNFTYWTLPALWCVLHTLQAQRLTAIHAPQP